MERIICKYCGGHNEVDSLYGDYICEYCGTPLELSPERARFKELYGKADDAWERKDFDEALALYEQIVAKDNTQAEAHWSAALCRYGVAYVVDPLRGNQIPTCNRINRTSILEDKNYLAAIRHASAQKKAEYQHRANEIDQISASYLAIVDQEKPYDVFISYKKTAEDGRLTLDSKYARKLYYYLKEKGVKVFYAEETLKGVAGNMYEPYIFAALTSARVMLLLGSKREYFEAVWVKNEWKRFLLLAEQDPGKGLIPICIRCKPEEALPVGMSQFQALDGEDINLTEWVYDIVKKKMGVASMVRPGGGRDILTEMAERYATKENVAKVVDTLDCEEKLAIETLIVKKGDVAATISSISLDPDYKKHLWTCTECGAKNTHEVCHKCGISHDDVIKLTKMREDAKKREEEERRKEYERSEEARRIRAAKRAVARKRTVTAIVIVALVLAAAVGVMAYINPMMDLRVVLPEGGASVFYREDVDSIDMTVEGKFLFGGWKAITPEELTVSGLDASQLGQQEITVSYNDKSASAIVEVLALDLSQPALSVQGEQITVQFATDYVGRVVLEINGEQHIFEGNQVQSGAVSYELGDEYAPGIYSVRAKVISKNDCVRDSAWSDALPVEILVIDLNQPVVSVKNGQINVKHATDYVGKVVLEINGKTHTFEGSQIQGGTISYELGEEYAPGTYSIRAKVVAKNHRAQDSAWSDTLTVTKLAPVEILERSGSKVTFEASDEAALYGVYIDGKLFKSITNTSFDLMQVERTGKHTISVAVLGTDSNNTISSAMSDAWEYTVLSNAVNITVSNGLLTWNSIEGAVGYEIYVNNILRETLDADTTALSVMRFYEQSGRASISIRVLGDGENMLTSPMSDTYVQIYDETYIPIRSADDLKLLANSADKFLLTTDIDLSGVNWTPIEGFTGTLVGNGCKIKNLTINASSDNVGFFGTLGGTVSDLVFENANITVTGRHENVGILCGTLTGMATNITTSGTVTAETCTNVGGIVGYMSRIGNYEITNLENKADVTGNEKVGGIFGVLINTTGNYTSYTLTLNELNNSGSVTGTSNYVGGIIGYVKAESPSNNTTAIYGTSLSNTGDVKGKQYVGGMIGYGYSDNSDSYLQDSTNASSVTAESYVGAIAGQLSSISVNDCDNAGSAITATGYVAIEGTKYAFVGGYVGYGYLANNCTNAVPITYKGGGHYVGGIMGYTDAVGTYEMKNLENTAEISGADCVGGIFGGLQNTTGNYTSYTLTLNEFKNSGSVTGSGDYVGGIIGYMRAESPSNNTTAIYGSSLSNTGAIKGEQHVGGLIGFGYSDNTDSYLQDCTNASSVTAKTYIGAIAGQLSNISVNDCDNAGSAVTATGYFAEDGVKYAYVGGYVGYGYLANNCTNTVSINYTGGGRYVGGIFGYTSAVGTYTMSNLENTAKISGADCVGGILGGLQNTTGNYTSYTLTLNEFKNSGSVTGSGDYVGGIIGYVKAESPSNNTTAIYGTSLSNTGDVKGKQYVGGLIGYGYSDNTDSYLQDSTNASSVTAESYVGAIAGQLSNISVNDCNNAGSSITATGYFAEDGIKYAYVGGYVGYGYLANNCTNTVSINYTGGGRYVGGIFGYTGATGTYTMSHLENTAKISGADCVGGILGGLQNTTGNYTSYTLTLNEFKNSGSVTGSGDYVGGIIGYLKAESPGSSTTIIYGTSLRNTGAIVGKQYVGGIFGYAYSDSSSSSVMDTVTTGVISGTYDYGEKYGYAENVTFE